MLDKTITNLERAYFFWLENPGRPSEFNDIEKGLEVPEKYKDFYEKYKDESLVKELRDRIYISTINNKY